MANQNTTIIVSVIIFGLVAGTIFVPPLIQMGINNLRNAFADFRDVLFGDLNGNETSTDEDGTSGTNYGFDGIGYVGATIRYADGSQRSFQFSSPYSIFPYTITDANAEISSITIELWITASFTSTPISYSVSGTLNLKLGSNDVLGNWATTDYTYATTQISQTSIKTPIQSGVSTKIWEKTYQSSTMETWFQTTLGDYAYFGNLGYFADDVTIDFTWEDGHSETYTLSAYSVHSLMWYPTQPTQRIESVSLTINPSRLWIT